VKLWHWVAVLSILLAGCSTEKVAETGDSSGDAGRPLVYASNYPLQYFAARISTPLFDIRMPVPAGEDPAFWKPEAEDILALQQADLIVLNGASYESWLKKVSLPGSRLVDTSEGLKEQFIALEEETTHSHGLDGEHEHSATAFTTWLDLTLAVEQARAVKNAFAERWPEYEGQFEAQFDRLAQELEALDAEFEEIVSGAPDLHVVFSHPVYQYFARRYGVNGRNVHWEPHEMPSDGMWQELAALLGSHPANWMIWEGEPSSDNTAKLSELGIRSVVFDPCAGTPDGGDFVSVMKLNMAALKTVFGQPVRRRKWRTP
jgi:zinc transport system substrate-binding protein